MNFRSLSFVSIIVSACVTKPDAITNHAQTLSVQCRETGDVATMYLATIQCDAKNISAQNLDVKVAKLGLPQNYSGAVASPRELQKLRTSLHSTDGNLGLIGTLLIGGLAVAGHGAASNVGLGEVAVIATIPENGRSNGAAAENDEEAYSNLHILGGREPLEAGKIWSHTAIITFNEASSPPEFIEVCFVDPASECLHTDIEPWGGRVRLRSH